MSPAMRETESLILERKIRHGNHPALNMCVANAVTEGKDASNRRLSKKRSSGRIDGWLPGDGDRGCAGGMEGQVRRGRLNR